MTDAAAALNKLGVTEWFLSGEPTTEAEFSKMFRKFTGTDDNGLAIESSAIYMGRYMDKSLPS